MDASPHRLPALLASLVGILALTSAGVGRFPLPGSAPLLGQEVTSTPDHERRNSLVPMPILFRQPETGTGFGTAATWFFRLGSPEDSGGLDKADLGSGAPSLGDRASTAEGKRGRAAFPSTLTAVAIYTTRSQLVTAVEPAIRLREDRIRITGALEFVRFPTTFWGVGNDTGDEEEEGYSARAFNLEMQVLREVRAGWYGGVVGRFARRKLLDVEPGGLLDRGAVPGTKDGQIAGLGLGISRDTRDRSMSPASGALHQLRLVRFAPVLGSAFEYSQVSVDLRLYLPLGPGRVLAVRGVGERLSGTVPFDALPQLGGAELLRGYYGGRFRDKSLTALQAELRSHLVWRIGLAGFGAVGQVAPSVSGFQVDGMKAAVGGGLRFAINRTEGLNLRADLAWGLNNGTRAFYLTLGEAF